MATAHVQAVDKPLAIVLQRGQRWNTGGRGRLLEDPEASLSQGLGSPIQGVEYSVGDTVTLHCQERCDTTVPRDSITLITWRKHNTSHFLLFSTDTWNKTFSNFSDRFSFQDPLTLQIRDAQQSDSGDYTCEVTSSHTGVCSSHHILYESSGLASPLCGVRSPVYGVEHSAGDTVTLCCLERCNTTIPRDRLSQITWRKHNHPHFLLFINDTRYGVFSNFSDSRFSFQDPLTLQIRDTQQSDTGNYTCEVTSSHTGVCTSRHTLHVLPVKPPDPPAAWKTWRWIFGAGFFVISLALIYCLANCAQWG
ncbi:zwei Ig domain protein zig-8-like [Hyperolius riggenbachi]|uniref:zwei Ig domain protein zig-8-like n=1 Tax=Hyperolius riggenbachi TaxID=752182 RepID=UPI0035A38B39